MEDDNRLKAHFQKHGKTYLWCLGTAVGVATITYLIVKGTELQGGSGSELQGGSEGYGSSVANATRPSLLAIGSRISDSQNTTNHMTVSIHTGTRGNSGFMTRHIESGMVFRTQKAAAEYFDIPEAVLSAHLNSPKGSLDEGTFERIVVAE